jgi:5'-deoxynucleotidase YfbR-like HD superfamily hydrolase
MNDQPLKSTEMKTSVWLSRRLSMVPRWVVIPTIRTQTVAEHSFNVACLCDYLVGFHSQSHDPYFRHMLMATALRHDLEEAITGDSPSPIKASTRKAPGTLSSVETVVKVADKIDAALFCMDEIEMGNTAIKDVLEDVLNKGVIYWFHFSWGDDSRKPQFRELVHTLHEECRISRHPTLEL